MIFDLTSTIQYQQALTRLKYLHEKKSKIELTEKQQKFTWSQIKYVHLLIQYYGVQVGLTEEEAKLDFKQLNESIFAYQKNDKTYFRSLASLDKEEMSIAIDHFITFAEDNGFWMPRVDNQEQIDEAHNEVQRNKSHL